MGVRDLVGAFRGSSSDYDVSGMIHLAAVVNVTEAHDNPG